ncbi:hypothetical protein GLAREA_09407 [Glarea lozoyensis ATCC 20868]|uniref:Uncharacterized protein n=1 Tax=Glarea lozoyensis (strain ATCC 20868 / MF5171) TaxID=1116229 RepID=S3CPB4_GLAL2|nr:uncharacterized protein GLAREA_09407 [Glarea lozoyensis ATCC 20868]EPE28287.1 hypothetical protein GLAREA_09407 [Glarea lozoyensis ATCC 20868]
MLHTAPSNLSTAQLLDHLRYLKAQITDLENAVLYPYSELEDLQRQVAETREILRARGVQIRKQGEGGKDNQEQRKDGQKAEENQVRDVNGEEEMSAMDERFGNGCLSVLWRWLFGRWIK